MNTDYYQQQIQRLEADRNFWMNAAEADKRKVAELTAALEKAREELRIMKQYTFMTVAEFNGVEVFCDTDEDGGVCAIYAAPNDDITPILDAKAFYSIENQVLDAQEEEEATNDLEDRLARALFRQSNGG